MKFRSKGMSFSVVSCIAWMQPLCLLFVAPTSFAAEADSSAQTLAGFPVGITLPVELPRTLRAGKAKQGSELVLKTTQRVPIAEHVYLNRGAELIGKVVESKAGDGSSHHPPALTIQFTSLRYNHQTKELVTKTIAAANFTDVEQAFVPATQATDRGNSSAANWTTMQVGGDEVSRSGWIGDLSNDATQKVGFADYYGVYGLPQSDTDRKKSKLPRALGVFSSTAAGLYGFDPGSELKSQGGLMTVIGGGKSLVLHGGDNFLVEVVAIP